MTSILLPEVTKAQLSKKITRIKPFGSSILVKRLSSAEIMGTSLYVSGAPFADSQVRIVEFGPSCKPEDLGLKVGDRLVCIGNAAAVPSLDGEHEYNVVEVHNIKAVLEEE